MLQQEDEDGPDGYRVLKMVPGQLLDGTQVMKPTAAPERDILRRVLLYTRWLLGMIPEPLVSIYEWQTRAMRVQRRMCSGPLAPYGTSFFVNHPTVHYALVHGCDAIREQNLAGDATEGRFLCMEAGEHHHQDDMETVKSRCRPGAAQRSHDLLMHGKVRRGLSVEAGYVPISFSLRKSFH